MQEKMTDKQAELDALRAKRAAEEAERQWRKVQQVEAERAMAIQASLDAARAAQKMEKERRLIEQAQQEKEEFDRILRVQREIEELEKEAKMKRHEAATSHMEELQAQIMMNAEQRKKNRMDYLQDGVGQRTKLVIAHLNLHTNLFTEALPRPCTTSSNVTWPHLLFSQEMDRLKLEAIRAEKLSTLQALGVPQKYTVDLANKRFA